MFSRRDRRRARTAWLLAVASVAAVALTGCGRSGTPAEPPPYVVPSAAATTLAAADTARLTAALTSKDPATVSAVLAPDVRAAFDKAPRPLLPAGSAIEILAGQMLVSDQSATVPAKVVGGSQAGTWLLVLQRQDGQWLLVGTQKR